jgi:hypothetical protein
MASAGGIHAARGRKPRRDVAAVDAMNAVRGASGNFKACLMPEVVRLSKNRAE